LDHAVERARADRGIQAVEPGRAVREDEGRDLDCLLRVDERAKDLDVAEVRADEQHAALLLAHAL
jgi:hypothetical protein